MTLALAEARRAPLHGDVPVGAVGLRGGIVVASAHNERELTGDPSAHAEMLVIRRAAHLVGHWHLEDLTVVVTLEPCVMCAGVLVAARVGRVLFGAQDPKAGAAGSIYQILGDSRLNHSPTVSQGVLADECGSILAEFFANRRKTADPSRLGRAQQGR